MADSNNLDDSLKPFYQRASEAELAHVTGSNSVGEPPGIKVKEGRGGGPSIHKVAKEQLARLEIAVASKKDSRNEELERTVAELQSKLEGVTAELKAEKEKAHKQVEQLTAENAKLKYRVKHLVQSLKEVLSKSASK